MKNYLFPLCALLLLLGAACELEDPDQGVPVEELFTFSADKESILADSNESATLTVTLGPLTEAEQMVTFQTEKGSFVGAAAEAPQEIAVTSSQRTAQAILRSGNLATTEVRIFAQIGDFQQSRTIRYQRAFPDRMKFTANKTSVEANRSDNATLTVEVFREEGVPSTGLQVTFETIPRDSATARIEPFAFTSGTRVAVQVLSENGQPGVVDVIATVPGENQTTLSEMLTILFE